MRRLIRSAALTIPFLVPALAGDAPAAQVLYTGKRQQPLPLSNVGDPSAVAKARLFVTTDEGKTWVMAHELQIAEGTKDLPKFPFSTDKDGAFGLMPCLTYRKAKADAKPGQPPTYELVSEPEPKPGQIPPYVLVVDTLAPAVKQFDATLIGRSTAKVVVRVTWSIEEINPDKEPIAIEASTDGGAHFIAIHRGASDGAVELTVPVATEAAVLQLRLVATDRARNVTISPARDLMLAPMPEPKPADAKEALAQALATLPSVDEVRVDNRPLPTTPIAPPSQENPAAAAAPKPGSAPAPATAAPTPTPAAAPTTAPPAAPAPRPDVVVDGRAYPPTAGTPAAPAAPATGDANLVIADNSVDQAYYEALAATRPTPLGSNPKTAPRPVFQPRAPEPAPTAAARPGGDGQRPPASATPVIVDDEVKTLNDARVLATTGHLDDACDLYERLRFGSLGKTALLEQTKLLVAAERPRDALTAITSAPIEIVDDPVRIEWGTLLLAAGRAAEVEPAVAGVTGSGPEARPALLLIAKAYAALGRTPESRRALEWLAKGKDDVAIEARSLLGR